MDKKRGEIEAELTALLESLGPVGMTGPLVDGEKGAREKQGEGNERTAECFCQSCILLS